MLTEKQIDQTMAELHDGIRSLDIWDALWLMGVQAKRAIDLAAENERLKAKLDAVRKWAYQMVQESVLAILDEGGDSTTNYDRIMRDMTVERMAELLIEPLEEADSGMVFYHTSTGGSYDYDDAIRAEIEWLKKEDDA